MNQNNLNPLPEVYIATYTMQFACIGMFLISNKIFKISNLYIHLNCEVLIFKCCLTNKGNIILQIRRYNYHHIYILSKIYLRSIKANIIQTIITWLMLCCRFSDKIPADFVHIPRVAPIPGDREVKVIDNCINWIGDRHDGAKTHGMTVCIHTHTVLTTYMYLHEFSEKLTSVQ